jgi:hypothetical protein
MKLASVVLARFIATISLEEMNPLGRIFYPDLAKGLVDQFRFQKFPKESWELAFAGTSGVEFEHGKIGDIVIQKLSIFRNGLALDTASSTSDSKSALRDILSWGVEKFAVNYKPEMVKKTSYYSQVVVHLDTSLDSLNSFLSILCKRVSELVSAQLGEPVPYETYGISLSFDPSSTKLTPGGFSIEKRIETPFSENKYFSGAPLQTADHLKFLEEFESALKT